jgi:large subunit ribosomal protein L29
MKVFELREKSREELIDLLNGLHKELFNLRLRRAAQELPNPLRLRTLRRDIARIRTVLREDEMGIKKVLVTPKIKKSESKKSKKSKRGEVNA